MFDSHPAPRRPSGTRRQLLAGVGVCASGILAGCATRRGASTPPPEEGTITIRLRNRDSVPRPFEVVVQQGDTLRDEFSGTLPADQTDPIEMVATVRITDAQYDFRISTDAGQRGRTWEPTECDAFLVEAYVDAGDPGFEPGCRRPSS
jgi:hypothetical protein